MKSKTMILMGVAIVCGLGASYMTSRLLAERNEKVIILAAKQKSSQWTIIKDPTTMFEEKEVLKTEAPKTAVLHMDDLKDRVLLRGLTEGQAVVQEDLQPKGITSLDTQLPPGKRAVAIKTDATTSAGGFVLPGSHVDVIHANGKDGSRMVLQNVLVRAVDLQSTKPDDKQAFIPATVTLEVTPEEALILAPIASGLTLALRPVGDSAEVAQVKPPAPPEKKLDLPPAPVEKKVEAPPEPVDQKTMTIYNGMHWTQANFITKNGKVTTEIQGNGQSEPITSAVTAAPPPPPRQVLAPQAGSPISVDPKSQNPGPVAAAPREPSELVPEKK